MTLPTCAISFAIDTYDVTSVRYIYLRCDCLLQFPVNLLIQTGVISIHDISQSHSERLYSKHGTVIPDKQQSVQFGQTTVLSSILFQILHIKSNNLYDYSCLAKALCRSQFWYTLPHNSGQNLLLWQLFTNVVFSTTYRSSSTLSFSSGWASTCIGSMPTCLKILDNVSFLHRYRIQQTD